MVSPSNILIWFRLLLLFRVTYNLLRYIYYNLYSILCQGISGNLVDEYAAKQLIEFVQVAKLRGFARRWVFSVSPRSVTDSKGQALWRRPRRPEEARFSCFFLEFHIMELLPPRRQSLSGKRRFLRFSSAPTPKLARRIVQIRRIWAQAGKSSAERN